jgi:cell division protein FtsW
MRPQATPSAPGRRVPDWLDHYDPWLLGLALFLIGFGLVLVASASITVAERNFGAPLYYFTRQACAAALGLSLAWVVLKLPLKLWQKLDLTLLLAGLGLLVLVLIPGVGLQVNGSMRWIDLGPVSLQASEPVKLCVIV